MSTHGESNPATWASLARRGPDWRWRLASPICIHVTGLENAADALSTTPYRTLDAWRGLAALAVVLFHCSNGVVSAEDGLVSQIALQGWLGVFIFFPISGYCVYGATQRVPRGGSTEFLKGRWRRIGVPYWASLALALTIGVLALPFSSGSIADLALDPGTWLAVLSLTQVFTDRPDVLNPVYWSLGYEAQFYVVMGICSLVARQRRVLVLTGLTFASAVFIWFESPLRGLFLSYWPCFAVGCAAHIWIHERGQRGWAWTIAGGALASALLAPTVWTSVLAAAAFVALAPLDDRLIRARLVVPLASLGVWSYSLYLTHVPIGGRVVNLLRETSLPVWSIVVAGVGVSLAAAYAFYLLIERRYQPRPLGNVVMRQTTRHQGAPRMPGAIHSTLSPS
jgi:peptidoglycan/LPS O-acetylase OafA/YrhL